MGGGDVRISHTQKKTVALKNCGRFATRMTMVFWGNLVCLMAVWFGTWLHGINFVAIGGCAFFVDFFLRAKFYV